MLLAQGAATDRLVDLARGAMARAYAPYSDFAVGVALRDEAGGLHAGANVENASYPQGQCAETSAIGALVAGGGHADRGGRRHGRHRAHHARAAAAASACASSATPTRPSTSPARRGSARTFTLGDLLPHSFTKDDL